MLNPIIKTDHTGSITVQASAKEIFICLTDRIKEWWTETMEGSSANKADEFTVRFGSSYKTFRVVDKIKPEIIVWRCTDALIDIPELENKKEWIGTKVVWEILPMKDISELKMTHVGLTPQMDCFDICEKGWNYFLASLEKLISTGSGEPFKKEAVSKT